MAKDVWSVRDWYIYFSVGYLHVVVVVQHFENLIWELKGVSYVSKIYSKVQKKKYKMREIKYLFLHSACETNLGE